MKIFINSKRIWITLVINWIGCLSSPTNNAAEAGNVCLETFTKRDNHLSIGGTPQQITDLSACLEFCRFSEDCVAVDFNIGSSSDATITPCWTHTDRNDLVGDNVYYDSNVAQYIMNRTCLSVESTGVGNCQLTWKRLSRLHSVNAEGYDYWTEYDCFTFCRFKSDCVAADFDIASSPPCWIHTDIDDLTPDNTYDDSMTAVQFQMNRTCPPPANSSFQLGQCVGYPMKTGSWCSNDSEIHIVKASYKGHPLCCSSPGAGDLLNVPDSPSLPEWDIYAQNDNDYKQEIENCKGKTSCSINAKAYDSSAISNVYCPKRLDRTNYVSITYSCVAKGHTDPSTTKPLTSQQPMNPTAPQTHMTASTIQTPDSKFPTSASMNFMMSNQSSNKDALILGGFGVALGGLAILILIAIGVWWFFQNERNKAAAGHGSSNPMYNNNGSVLSNDSADNSRYRSIQMKGVSTTAVYPETEYDTTG